MRSQRKPARVTYWATLAKKLHRSIARWILKIKKILKWLLKIFLCWEGAPGLSLIPLGLCTGGMSNTSLPRGSWQLPTVFVLPYLRVFLFKTPEKKQTAIKKYQEWLILALRPNSFLRIPGKDCVFFITKSTQKHSTTYRFKWGFISSPHSHQQHPLSEERCL